MISPACEQALDEILDNEPEQFSALVEEHLEHCESCQEAATQAAEMQGLFDKLAQAADEHPSSLNPDFVVKEAFARFYAYRRRKFRLMSIGVVVAALAVGVFFLALPDEKPPDPVDYARQLFERVFGPRGSAQTDYDLLKRDEALRAEYLAALDHESSWVRRTALMALSYSQVPVEPAPLLRILKEWNEDLVPPVVTADADSHGRHVREALAERRVETVHAALHGLHLQLPGIDVQPDDVRPFLLDPSPKIRHVALRTLGRMDGFKPGEKVTSMFEADPDPAVRIAAGTILVERLHGDGLQAVVQRLQREENQQVVRRMIPLLGHGELARELARTQLERADIDRRAALQYARLLARAGEQTYARKRVTEALRAGDPEEVRLAIAITRELDWTEFRKAAIAALNRLGPGEGRLATKGLALWDLKSGDEGRMLEALELTGRGEKLHDFQHVLRRFLEAPFRSVRERAQALLDR